VQSSVQDSNLPLLHRSRSKQRESDQQQIQQLYQRVIEIVPERNRKSKITALHREAQEQNMSLKDFQKQIMSL